MVEEQYEYQKEVVPKGIPLPSLGLYSETEKSEGGRLNTAITDTVAEVIQGRQTLSDWDEAVKQWKQGGGDKIAAEYEEAYAQANG